MCQWVARYSIGCSTQSTSTGSVVNISQQLRQFSVVAAQLVGHLYLGHVEVLRATALSLESHCVLNEGWVSGVGWWKPEGYLGASRFVLVSALGVFLFRPLYQSIHLGLIVLCEVATNGLNKVWKLALVVARMCHQIGHHACWFLPTVVGVLKLGAADVCAKYGEKHRNQWFVHVF